MAAGVAAVVHVVAVGAVVGGEEVAQKGVILVLLHRAVVEAAEDEEEAHHHGEDGVVVIRDGAQEHGKAVDARAIRHRGRDGGGPAGHRRDDADGCCSGVDEVGQLCAGDLLPVSDRAHDGADGQAVEVVVHKDEDAQQQGGELRAARVWMWVEAQRPKAALPPALFIRPPECPASPERRGCRRCWNRTAWTPCRRLR